MEIRIRINSDCGEHMMNEQTLRNYCQAIETALQAEFPDANIDVAPTTDFDSTNVSTENYDDERAAFDAIQRITDALWQNQTTWVV